MVTLPKKLTDLSPDEIQEVYPDSGLAWLLEPVTAPQRKPDDVLRAAETMPRNPLDGGSRRWRRFQRDDF